MNHTRAKTKPALRIAHTEASLGWGGQEIRILTESAGMIARGHQVTLLCPRESTIFDEAITRGIPVEALQLGRKNLTGIRAMRSWLASNSVDVVNTHSSTDTWLTALASLTLRNAPPLVRTRHISSPTPKNLPTRWLYQTATCHIATTGKRLRQQLIRENGYAPDSITSVPTGIDIAHFVPGDRSAARVALGLPVEGPVIGIVATLRSWKGHRFLVEAFAQLAHADATLLIVGDGPVRTALNDQISQCGLQGRVVMPGNKRDVRPWLHAMDVFVLPSYANEGVPQAILQAMLCRLAIVTTDAGSIAEAVENEVSGLIVPAQNAKALALAITRLLADERLRSRLGTEAQRSAKISFGQEGMLDRMENIFHDVVKHG